MRKLPKLPKLFDATGLDAKLTPLAKRILEWSRAVQDYLTALNLFLNNEDFHRADRIGKTELSPRLPTEGQVLTATKAGQAAEWQDAPAGYTDEQAQDAVGGIVGPTTGPYTLIYNDAVPSITLDVDDMVGDSGSGGVEGLVPAPAAGDAAASKFLKADGSWAVPSGGGSTVGVWMPDAPPASPSVYDDEFTAGTLDAKWSEFDPGSVITVAMDTTRKMVVLTDATGSGAIAGIVQPLPNAELALYMRWHGDGAAGSPSPAFILTQGLISTSDVFITYIGVYRNSANNPGVAAFAYSDYTGTSGTTKGSANIGMVPGWLRLRLPNDGNFYVDVSPCGVGFHHVFSNSIGILPAYFGIGLWTSPGVPGTVRYPYFRAFSGPGASAFGANHIGRYVNVSV